MQHHHQTVQATIANRNDLITKLEATIRREQLEAAEQVINGHEPGNADRLQRLSGEKTVHSHVVAGLQAMLADAT